MNGRGVVRQRGVGTNQLSIIDVRVMVHTCPCRSQAYFTISVGRARKVRIFESKGFFAKQTGRYMIPCLIEALTQDEVLKAVSPNKRPEVSQ